MAVGAVQTAVPSLALVVSAAGHDHSLHLRLLVILLDLQALESVKSR